MRVNFLTQRCTKIWARPVLVLAALTMLVGSAYAADEAKPKRKPKAEAAAPAAAALESAPSPLSAEQLALAERVYRGVMPCELGAQVEITAHASAPGYFDLRHGKHSYRVAPVPTSTGTLRMEDARGEIVWLQLLNKSMLMNRKLGQRVADECQSPAQVTAAQALKDNPPPNMFEQKPDTAPATAPKQ